MDDIKEKSMKELIEELVRTNKEALENKKKPWFKLPAKAKLNKGHLKKNYVTVMYIKENKECDFVRVPIDESTTLIEGTPRLATAEYTLTHKGKPIIIQPAWSVKPFSPTESYNKTLEDGDSSAGYKLLLNKLKKEVIMPKKGPGGWLVWVLIAIAVVGVGYYLLKSGGIIG